MILKKLELQQKKLKKLKSNRLKEKLKKENKKFLKLILRKQNKKKKLHQSLVNNKLKFQRYKKFKNNKNQMLEDDF